MGLKNKDEKYIGEVLFGQGWVELKGVFTIDELTELILKINTNYEMPEKDHKE
jgi:hypothetical protein